MADGSDGDRKIVVSTTNDTVHEEFSNGALVYVLEAFWYRDLRVEQPDLPDLALVVGKGARAGRLQKLGHWGPDRWCRRLDAAPAEALRVGEVFIAGELFAFGAAAILGTLLHEAAHALAHARLIEDTSRDGRYHNKRFRALASALGLEVARSPKNGWNITTLPSETADRYGDVLLVIEDHIRGFREWEGRAAESGIFTVSPAQRGTSRLLRAECACVPPRLIRLSATCLSKGKILCESCKQQFLFGGAR
ncbi:MAG: hypothetical protein ACOZNI_20195 [Myxococcota bacterium]